MLKKLSYLLVFTTLIWSCNPKTEEEKQIEKSDKIMQAHFAANNITPLKGAEGIYYVITKKSGSGKKPQLAEVLDFNTTVELLNKTVVDTSYKSKVGYSLYGKGSLIDLFSVYLEKGDEATFYVPFNLVGNGDTDRGPIPAYSPLVFKVKLTNIRNEAEQIASYIAENKYNMTKTTSGLYYQITNPIATGEVVKSGQTLVVKYTGKLLYYSEIVDNLGKSTNVFDSGQFSVTLGQNQVIKGFEEGLSKLKVGEKAVLIFPSDLGYGKNGSGSSISPYAPLLFEVEVTSAR